MINTARLPSINITYDQESRWILWKPTKKNWKEPYNQSYLTKKAMLAKQCRVEESQLILPVNAKGEYWIHPRLASFILAPRDTAIATQLESWMLDEAVKGHDFTMMINTQEAADFDYEGFELLLQFESLNLQQQPDNDEQEEEGAKSLKRSRVVE